jgi:hypothetical protein
MSKFEEFGLILFRYNSILYPDSILGKLFEMTLNREFRMEFKKPHFYCRDFGTELMIAIFT